MLIYIHTHRHGTSIEAVSPGTDLYDGMFCLDENTDPDDLALIIAAGIDFEPDRGEVFEVVDVSIPVLVDDTVLVVTGDQLQALVNSAVRAAAYDEELVFGGAESAGYEPTDNQSGQDVEGAFADEHGHRLDVQWDSEPQFNAFEVLQGLGYDICASNDTTPTRL